MILRRLCAAITEKMEDKNEDSPCDYLYESLICTGAEVNFKKDSIEEIRRKVQAFWAGTIKTTKPLFECFASCALLLYPVIHFCFEDLEGHCAIF